MASVTVVVPTFNRAALLDATLRAILAQSVSADEIIVVDDGSTDDTPSVCARQPKHVRYIRQENTGLPAYARNRAIAEATTDWIAFCDSDDCWHPRKLEVQLAAIEATGAEWSVTGFGLIDPDGARLPAEGLGYAHEFPVFKQLGRSPEAHFRQRLTKVAVPTPIGLVDVFAGDAFGMLFQGNVCLTSTAMVRRDLLARAGGYDPSFMAEDTEFFHRLAAHGPVAILMSALLDYRVGHPSMMSARDLTPFIQSALRSIDLAAQLRPQLTPIERAAYRSGRQRLRMRLAYQRLSVFDRAGARHALVEGWRSGELVSPLPFVLFLASLMPPLALRVMHSAKRGLRWAAHSRLGTRRQADKRAMRVRADDDGARERGDRQTDSGAAD
jgi:glycosyltransferase involved in cell wall biosynthesis